MSLSEHAFVRLQYLLPQHTLSRLVRHATRSKVRWFKNLLIGRFLRHFDVDMEDALETDARRYPSFNEFFTRPLKPGRRPLDPAPGRITSPVDGRISQCGTVHEGCLLQAKGHRYSLMALLAGQPWASQFASGSYCTFYLAPNDYHRIHMPASGELRTTVHVPGRLFSVNAATARHVPNLFARNERLLALFDSDAGSFCVILVGALNVGSLSTVWTGEILPANPRRAQVLDHPPVHLDKGAEMGRFNMGSTVILLFEPGRARLDATLAEGRKVRFGEGIGSLRDGGSALSAPESA